ncbi:hypothetical protein K461DRAFT_293136 [Myriangium duriaei CBS 260.36]|uniref:Uncharacterized protein n=1 Tax=Myriangium duriaei CBS 260.36 TaxID=1168546 RepID=A0A9P4J798_9PEZI|nr:hypothetical protein K461DRAFT_293136 [Myriangium duriaei CBS 260.36]
MALLKAFLASTLATVAFANIMQRRQTVVSCPSGQSAYSSNGQSWCCPGQVLGSDGIWAVASNNDDGAYCCFGAAPMPTDSSADLNKPCFPYCEAKSAGPQTCSATVALNDPKYTSKINAGGDKPTSTGSTSGTSTSSSTPTSNSADTTTSSTTASGTNAANGTNGSSGSGTAQTDGSASATGGTGSSSSSATSASKGLGARVTSGPLVGAFMAAGGYLVAAM